MYTVYVDVDDNGVVQRFIRAFLSSKLINEIATSAFAYHFYWFFFLLVQLHSHRTIQLNGRVQNNSLRRRKQIQIILHTWFNAKAIFTGHVFGSMLDNSLFFFHLGSSWTQYPVIFYCMRTKCTVLCRVLFSNIRMGWRAMRHLDFYQPTSLYVFTYSYIELQWRSSRLRMGGKIRVLFNRITSKWMRHPCVSRAWDVCTTLYSHSCESDSNWKCANAIRFISNETGTY